jgi:hypothetical protein
MSQAPYQRWIGTPGTPVTEADFHAMSTLEANRFVKELVRRVPERMEEVERYIRSTRGFSSWRADCSPDSLAPLGKWLAKVVKTRPLTEAERTPRVIGRLPKGISLTDIPVDSESLVTVAEESMSELVDVGMYYGQTLVHRDRVWCWRRNRCTPSVLGYNQPVISYGLNGFIGLLLYSGMNAIAWQILAKRQELNCFVHYYIDSKKFEVLR